MKNSLRCWGFKIADSKYLKKYKPKLLVNEGWPLNKINTLIQDNKILIIRNEYPYQPEAACYLTKTKSHS